MDIEAVAALTGTTALLAAHAASALDAGRRQAPKPPLIRAESNPRLAIIRPLKGVDAHTVACLASTFELDADNVERIFCVASPHDPVVPVITALIDAHPGANASLLVGDERISENPKLNNLVKAWHATKADWVAFIDANVLLPSDAVGRLFAQWGPGVGLVSSPPLAVMPEGWEALTECAMLNSYQGRWQTFADTLGHGFAQGKVLMFRRDLLDTVGGLRALAAEAAEDAAATKIVRAQGLSVRLVDRFFDQPVGRRSLKDVWQRQARWACLRRASFPFHYTSEVLSYPWLAVALAASIPEETTHSIAAGLVTLLFWYRVEAVCAGSAGWPEKMHHRLLRDLLLPAAWLRGWARSDFTWQGHAMRTDRGVAAKNA